MSGPGIRRPSRRAAAPRTSSGSPGPGHSSRTYRWAGTPDASTSWRRRTLRTPTRTPENRSPAWGRGWRSLRRCCDGRGWARGGAPRSPRIYPSTPAPSPRPASAGASCCPDALGVCPGTVSRPSWRLSVWGIYAWTAECGGSRRRRGVAVARRSPWRGAGSPSGVVGSLGRSFLADHEVDGSAQVLLGAGDVGTGAEGGDLLLDESFYLIGEDEVFLGQNQFPRHIIYMDIYV